MTNFMEDLAQLRERKVKDHEQKVIHSSAFKASAKHLAIVTHNFVNALRIIVLYSRRAADIYDEFLMIRSIDDILQSAFGIQSLVTNGIHHMARREIRYLIETSVKYLVVDQEMMGKSLQEKLEYLESKIPSSSITVVSRMKMPFKASAEKSFRDEIKDLFYKSCAYVHPSRTQLEEQLSNYRKENYIGFESAEQLDKIVKVVFRVYDMVLVMALTGFGQSMSEDLFLQGFDDLKDFRIKKGKYMQMYSALFDHKRGVADPS
jgi:hypothetical protein